MKWRQRRWRKEEEKREDSLDKVPAISDEGGHKTLPPSLPPSYLSLALELGTVPGPRLLGGGGGILADGGVDLLQHLLVVVTRHTVLLKERGRKREGARGEDVCTDAIILQEKRHG